MEKISTWLEGKIIPIAMVLNSNRFLAAIRDAFILTFPISMATSIVALINTLVLSPDGLIAQILFLPKFFPNLADAQQLFSTISNGTISIMSIFIVFLVAENLTKHHAGDSTTSGITAISAFLIIYPSPQWLETGNFLKMDYLGARGLFTAMIVGCVVGEYLPKLVRNKRLQIKLPNQVPPAVARSFTSLIPVSMMLLGSAILAFIMNRFATDGLNEMIYTWIQTPLRTLGGNIFGVYLITLLIGILWFFGIHGPATLNPIIEAMFAEQGLVNGEHILTGKPLADIPYPVTYGMLSGVYGYMGGAGMTLGLLIAILLVSKRADYKEVAKMGLVPGLFNINEPVIFGLPLVLNPILAIPFILTPLVSVTIAYLATVVFKFVVPAGISVAWTMPGPIMSLLGTGGTWQGLLLGMICLVCSVFIYIPFLKVADRLYEKEQNVTLEEQTFDDSIDLEMKGEH